MKKINLFLVLILICGLSLSCGKNQVSQKDTDKQQEIINKKDYEPIKVYFIREKDEGQIVLVTAKRWIKKDDNLIEGALRELFLGPSKKEQKIDVKSEIPTGTRLIGIEESDNDVYINLSNQFLIGGGAASVQMRYIQLFKTLKQVEPVKKLYLRIEGEELKYISGDGLELTHPMTKIDEYIKKYDNKKDLQP